MTTKRLSFPVLLATVTVVANTPISAAENIANGKAVFEKCAACHSLEAGKNEIGPSLHGLFGRKSASESTNYSPAMKRANVIWTPEVLDSYLADPQAGVFRGNRMPFPGLPDPQERTDVIAYLKQATL
jgi:cytochrome c2